MTRVVLFVENGLMGVSAMEKVLEDKPELAYDFQVLINMNGYLCFIDFDGLLITSKSGKRYCPKGPGSQCSHKCLNRLRKPFNVLRQKFNILTE